MSSRLETQNALGTSSLPSTSNKLSYAGRPHLSSSHIAGIAYIAPWCTIIVTGTVMLEQGVSRFARNIFVKRSEIDTSNLWHQGSMRLRHAQPERPVSTKAA